MVVATQRNQDFYLKFPPELRQRTPLLWDIVEIHTRRPQKAKRVFETEKANLALKQVAYQMEQWAAQRAKGSKAFDEFINIKEQENFVTLFICGGYVP